MTETADASCMWLYGVTASKPTLPDQESQDRDAPPPNGWETVPGVAGERVREIREAGLVALAGVVPQSEFGQPAIQQNLERLDWLSAVASAHDAVVRSAMGRTPVIPVRLVTLFSDEAAIRSLLKSRRADFERTLSHLRGRTEWGVKAFGEPETDAEPAAPPAAQAPASGPGTSYLLRRQAARTERQRTLRAAGERGDRLHARLGTLSVAARRNPLRATVTRGSRPIVLNGTYLVDDRCLEAFRDAVAAENEDEAVRVELSGPWPPYSFAAVPGLMTDA